MLKLKSPSIFAKKITSSAVVSIFFLMLSSTASAKAATLVFNTSDSQFAPGADNQGWWSNIQPNYNYNAGYGVGEWPGGQGFRNFFTFNLAALPQAETVVSATLRLFRYNSPSVGTYKLFDVSTPAAILNNNNGMNDSIYNDLASGNSYGTFNINQTITDSQGAFSFALNSTAISDINLAKGSFFSIGGSFQFQNNGYNGWYLFSNSDSYGIQSLVVETVPTPVHTPVPTPTLLPGLIGLGVSALRRRKQLEAVAP